jgi:hypothetical protein
MIGKFEQVEKKDALVVVMVVDEDVPSKALSVTVPDS